ncbi:MAG: PQQ-binding-like beta-propeller repeat protein [Pirellulales bacterium]|nr:PQQ-binding-like beta-propeller repeat protein [Pirellulales bacterium]
MPATQRRLMFAAACALTLVVVTRLGAAEPGASQTNIDRDWPMWGRTPARNLVAADATPPETWDVDVGKNIKWIAELGGATYGNPVLADGRLFVGTNNEHPRDSAITGDRGVVMCFRATDGQFLWQDVYDKLAAGDSQDWQLIGIGSSPAVANGRVYYVTNRGQVVAADVEGFADGENDGPATDESRTGAHDADIVWRFDMLGQLGVIPRYLAASNPLVVEGRVFVVTSNGIDPDSNELKSPTAPSFLALDAATGKLLWQVGSVSGSQHKVHLTSILEGQWGSPCWVPATKDRAAQVCFPGGDGWLYALDPATGALVWKFDCNPPGSVWKPGGRGDRNYILSTPVAVDGVVYVATGVDPQHGSGAGQLVAVETSGSGDVTATHGRWRIGGKQFGRSISSVAVHDGIVYAAELAGFLHALDAATGKELWQQDTLAEVWGSTLAAAGRVYLGDGDGKLTVVKAGRKLELVAENQFDESIYGTPIAAGRTLYLATQSKLIAIEEPVGAANK